MAKCVRRIVRRGQNTFHKRIIRSGEVPMGRLFKMTIGRRIDTEHGVYVAVDLDNRNTILLSSQDNSLNQIIQDINKGGNFYINRDELPNGFCHFTIIRNPHEGKAKHPIVAPSEIPVGIPYLITNLRRVNVEFGDRLVGDLDNKATIFLPWYYRKLSDGVIENIGRKAKFYIRNEGLVGRTCQLTLLLLEARKTSTRISLNYKPIITLNY